MAAEGLGLFEPVISKAWGVAEEPNDRNLSGMRVKDIAEVS